MNGLRQNASEITSLAIIKWSTLLILIARPTSTSCSLLHYFRMHNFLTILSTLLIFAIENFIFFKKSFHDAVKKNVLLQFWRNFEVAPIEDYWIKRKLWLWKEAAIFHLLERLTLFHQKNAGSNLAQGISSFFTPMNLPAGCQKSPKFRFV